MTGVADLGLRVVVSAMLVISGLIHLHLAKFYPAGKVITQETAFRIQAVVVFALAAAVLASPLFRRATWAATLLVAAGSLAALLLSRYWTGADKLPALVDEQTWQVGNTYIGLYEKQLAAYVEGVAAVLSLVAFGLTVRRPTRAG